MSEDTGRRIYLCQHEKKDKYRLVTYVKSKYDTMLTTWTNSGELKTLQDEGLSESEIHEKLVLKVVEGKSTGQSKVNSLAFAKAILDYSNEDRTTDKLKVSHDYPFLIDSPFTELSGQNLENVAKYIHTFANQIILMADDKNAMPINIDTTYRINRNQDQEEQMRYLWRDLRVFNDYHQILVISALIGYANNAYVPFVNKAEPVQIINFEDREKEIINFLAYLKEGNQSILQERAKDDPDRNKMYQAFEYYANGGFPILCKKLGVDFADKSKNDRNTILLKYYMMLVQNDLIDI